VRRGVGTRERDCADEHATERRDARNAARVWQRHAAAWLNLAARHLAQPR